MKLVVDRIKDEIRMSKNKDKTVKVYFFNDEEDTFVVEAYSVEEAKEDFHNFLLKHSMCSSYFTYHIEVLVSV